MMFVLQSLQIGYGQTCVNCIATYEVYRLPI
jgi:hypothetical protein